MPALRTASRRPESVAELSLRPFTDIEESRIAIIREGPDPTNVPGEIVDASIL
jgi:hypothetical protein